MAIIIEDLDIISFRGLADLQLKDLGNINIITGINNCGKTSLLEAIKTLQYPTEFGNIYRIAISRAMISKKGNIMRNCISSFRRVFDEDTCSYNISIRATIKGKTLDFDADAVIVEKVNFNDNIKPNENLIKNISKIYIDENNASEQTEKRLIIALKVKDGDNQSKYYKYELSENDLIRMELDVSKNRFNCLYVNTSINLYTSCVSMLTESILNNKKSEILKVMRFFDKDIKDLSILNNDVYIHSSKKIASPLFEYGSGMQKALLISTTIYNSANGLLLIDEADTALHQSAFSDVFNWMVKAAKEFNVQIFMTTHSLESIDSILEVSEKLQMLNEIRVITLVNEKGITHSRCINGEKALNMRDHFNFELRN